MSNETVPNFKSTIAVATDTDVAGPSYYSSFVQYSGTPPVFSAPAITGNSNTISTPQMAVNSISITPTLTYPTIESFPYIGLTCIGMTGTRIFQFY
jgi:hypothetical protein